MSIVSRIFSSRSSFRINARLAFFMDNLFAIGFGLGLRFVIDNVAHHDLRLTSVLVGLWEGVVTLHFLRKMPKSLDPYIAYATRLLVDFLVTENLTRLILVVVWTGLGMILADIAPAIWHDVGGRRKWRLVRRDLYYMTRSIPRLPPLFPRARVVRFSPVVRPTEISESVSTPTVASQVPKSDIVPPVSAPRAPKRPIPGGLPSSVVSETDSEATSALSLRPGVSAAGTSHAQYTIHKRAAPSDDSGSHTPSPSIDDSNVSSDSSSTSTATVSQAVDIGDQEEIEAQARRLDKGKGREMEEDISGTPTRSQIQLPPTPSDSYRPHLNRSSFVPTITGMPSIPDFFESGLGSDWENIRREEAEIKQPSPPLKKEVISPPVQYEPTYAPPSVYEPTPRPSTFDQDLWDDVSNAAPPTPYTTAIPPQRPSRPPPPTSMIPRSIPPISQPVKKKQKFQEPVPPPPVPQTPLYGDAWDTERDQLPPPTPEVLVRTPMNDAGLDLNQGSYAPPVKTESREPEPIHQDVTDPSASFDDPWVNMSQPPEEEIKEQQDTQQARGQSTVPPTPQTQIKMPSTPQFPTRAPPTPQVKAEAPSTPRQQSSKVAPSPQQKSMTVPSTPQMKPATVPPTPQQKPSTVPPTPQQKLVSVPSTPHQKPASMPPTPQQQLVPVPPTPQQQSAPRSFTPQQQPTSMPPTPQQQTVPVPPTPQRQPAPALPTPQQPPAPIPPTPQAKPSKTPPTPKQKASPPPLTPQQKSSPPLPPTPQRKSSPISLAPQQQKTTEAPPTPQQPTASVPPAPQQPTQTVYPTPKKWAQTLPPSPRQQNQLIPPTPSQRCRTVPSTPQHLNKPMPPTPLKQNSNDWDDLTQRVMKLDDGNTTGNMTGILGDSANQQTQQSNEENLVDLGGGENGGGNGGENGGENGNESLKTEGGGEDNNRGGGSNPHTREDEGFVQVDANSYPLSPASSGYSSVAGVPSEIKERNKQAIIIRAQIEEMTKTIARLKEEKLMAQGKEELDPLSEESTLKQQEILRAEKSLEKLVKRAAKRYQAAVESTQQLTVPKTLNLKFENWSAADATTRLEDVIGLFFNSDRRTIGLSITLPKGGAAKAMRAAITKVLEEYSLKSIAKMSGISVNLTGKSYTDMVFAFRQKHAKADDDS